MILKTSKKLFNFLRYASAAAVLFLVLYSPTLVIDRHYIQEVISEKIPFTKKKKHTETTVNRLEITDVRDGVVGLDIDGRVRYKRKVLGVKVSKSFKFFVHGRVVPKINGRYLSFDLLGLDVRKTFAKEAVEKVLSKKIKKIKKEIKPLKEIEVFANIKKVKFLDNGDLAVDYKLTKWLVLFVLFFMFFEVKYILAVSKERVRG